MIRLSTPGKIIKGIYSGWYIYIESLYGGYLILLSNMNNFEGNGKTTKIQGSQGYDNWVENYQSVELTFEINEWEVEWVGAGL